VNGPRYRGASPWRTLYVSTAILNWISINTVFEASTGKSSSPYHMLNLGSTAQWLWASVYGQQTFPTLRPIYG